MCVVSNTIDYHRDWWPDKDPYKGWPKKTTAPDPIFIPVTSPPQPYTGPTKEQFEEFLKLLRAAKLYDNATGQPDCEMDEKKKLVKELAERLGVPLPDDLWS